MVKSGLQFFLYLLTLMCAASCVVQNGSYTPSQAYYGHFEGPKTGQATLHLAPLTQNSSAGVAYALNKKVFVQAQGLLGSSYARVKGTGSMNAAADMQIGGYVHNKGYQCITASIGGGTGNTSFVRTSTLFGRFKYNHIQAQLGISENYGASRLSLGLAYRATNLYRGKIYLGSDLSLANQLAQVAEQKFTHNLSGHLAWGVRLSGPFRLRLAYDFTFYGMDYLLFDRDQASVGLVYDLGKMSRQVKPKIKQKKKGPKKHLDHDEEPQN